MTDQLAQNVKRLAKVLNKNDLQAFIEATEGQHQFLKPEVAEITMHKLRVEISGIRPDLKLKSAFWLKMNGYKKLSEQRT